MAFTLPAFAAPDTPEDLRNELLRGRTTGDWDGTLKAILERPTQVGETLGPIFTNPENARRVDLVARVGSYLAAHPVQVARGSRILLSDLILRRALLLDGDAFLDRLREPMVVDRATGRRPDWDLLLEAARQHLEQSDSAVPDRLAAMAFLARERGERSTEVLSSFAAEAKRQALASAPPAEKDELERALLDALDSVLAYRFASAADAARQLDDTKDVPLENRLRHFSHLKDGTAGDRAVAKKYWIEAVKQMEAPAALADTLREAVAYPEVRRAAVQRAAELKPRPVPEWTQFFVEVFKSVRDSKVVLDGLELLANAGFGGGPGECCGPVAAAIQERLARRSPSDGPDVRLRLVMTLGDLGSLAPVARQMGVVHERGNLAEAEAPEVVELILAAGRSPGVQADLLKPFYDLPGTTPEVRDALRTAVARALGREGVRAADPAAAVTALTSILDGGGGWERTTYAKAREAALSSLAAYPGPETADLLLRVAMAEGPESQDEALRAVEKLAKMMSGGTGGHYGALALVTLLERTKDKPELDARRVEALKRLKDLPPGDAVPAEVRTVVLAAVREALDLPGSDALREQAARTAADLADAEAIPPVTAWWTQQPTPEHTALLQALLEAVVGKPAPSAAKPDSDVRVADALRAVARVPGFASQAVQWAEALARSGARGGAARPILVAAHAQSLLYRASTWPPEPGGAALRQTDLAAACQNLRLSHQAARSPEEAERLRPLLMDALERLAEAYGPGEDAKALCLEAVTLAARSDTPAVLQAGARLGRRLKEEDAFKRLMKAADLDELDRQLETIRVRLER